MGMIKMMELLISTTFIMLILGSFVVSTFDDFSPIGEHGKLQKFEDQTKRSYFFKLISLTVPKSYFVHMYVIAVIGIFVNIVIFLSFHEWKSLFLLWKLDIILFLFHVCRRLIECIFITSFGSSRMNICGYLVGLFHYILVPICLLWCSERTIDFLHVSSQDYFSSVHDRCFQYSFAICLFLGSNYLQWSSHRILFLLKTNNNSNATVSHAELDSNSLQRVHGMPTNGLFEYVCCPHYFAEILVYVSLLLMDPSSLSRWCMCLWVGSNLTVVANKHFQWYQQHYPLQIQQKNLRRIFPFLW